MSSPRGKSGGGQVQLTDWILGFPDRLVFVEAKAVWIREDRIDGAPEGYLAFLRLKYGVTVSPGNRAHRKGIAQLAHSIRSLVSGEWTPDVPDLLTQQRIVPVLLVNDSLVDAPLHPWFLAREFARLLDPSLAEWNGQSINVGSFVVDNLIVMTVDDLEALEEATAKFSLADLFEDYSKACPDRLNSLHNYIVGDRKYGDALVMSTRVRQAFSDALEEAARTCG